MTHGDQICSRLADQTETEAQEDRKRGQHSGDQSPKSPGGCGAFPEHSKQHCCKQRRVDPGKNSLDVIHDGAELHGDIRRYDADEHSHHRSDAPDFEQVLVGGVTLEDHSVDIVSPYRIEGYSLTRLPAIIGHKSGKQGRNTQSHQSRRIVPGDQ